MKTTTDVRNSRGLEQRGLTACSRRLRAKTMRRLLILAVVVAYAVTPEVVVLADTAHVTTNSNAIAPPRPLTIPGLPNLGIVDTGIFRSGRPTSAGYDALRRLGVRTIINLERYPDDGEALRQAGIASIHIPLSVARRPTEAEVDRFLAAVTDTSLRPILIHCQRGIDRTGAMVGVFRVRVQDWRPARALTEMTAYGYAPEMFPLMAECVLEQWPPAPSGR